MKKSVVPFLLLTSMIGMTSCEDLIVLDIPEGSTKLVVDGLMTNYDSIQTISLSATSAYFDYRQTPRISGANVYVAATNGDTVQFKEDVAGIGEYKAIYNVKENVDYTLHIKTPDGRQYMSYPEKLLRVPPIELIQNDEILEELGEFRPRGYYVFFSTNEPAGIGDFYRWVIYINGERQVNPEYVWIADDTDVDGNPIYDLPYLRIYGLLPGDSVEIRQMSISKRAYHFWILLLLQVTAFGSPFDTPPASVEGNMKSLSDPDEVVLGYFGVSKVASDKIDIVQK